MKRKLKRLIIIELIIIIGLILLLTINFLLNYEIKQLESEFNELAVSEQWNMGEIVTNVSSKCFDTQYNYRYENNDSWYYFNTYDECLIQSVFDYTQDNINYVKDEADEIILFPAIILRGGDCEDICIFASAVLLRLGIDNQIRIIGTFSEGYHSVIETGYVTIDLLNGFIN
ncbi:MAG: hypothetical protein WC307_02520 [Candidatus Nanoarchaeia archaeon]